MPDNTLARELRGAIITRALDLAAINGTESTGMRRQFQVREVDEEARTVEVAFASADPVERWFGIEVLAMEPTAIRGGRLDGGAAVLVNHDWDDQIGAVESWRLDADGVARAVLRFGRSARASEIFDDIRDGIRRHVSVGYMVHRITVEERDGEPDLVTVTEWEPYEISIVAVPADPSVGVGRSRESAPEATPAPAANTADNSEGSPAAPVQTRDNMRTIITRNAAGDLVRAKVDDSGNIVEQLELLVPAAEMQATEGEAERRGADATVERVNRLLSIGAQFDAMDLARAAVQENRSVEDLQAQILERADRGGGLTGAGEIGMSSREIQRFSFLRVLRAMAFPHNRQMQEAAAFELEASEAAARGRDREPKGILVPADVLARALNTGTGEAAAGDSGGYAVGTSLLSQSFIDMLRNRTVMMRLATPLGGLVGNVDIPGQADGAVGGWIGEDEDAPEDALDLRQIGMRPKSAAAFSQITRRMIMQTSLDIEALVRRDIAAALALTIDSAAFYGSGTDAQPLGLKNIPGINAVNFNDSGLEAGSTELPSYKGVVAMETAIATDNADVEQMAYVGNAAMRGHLKTTEKFASSSGMPIWEPGDTVNGYGFETTNQITAGDLFFGNFADVMIGMWGGLDLTVDPYTESRKGRTRITAMLDVDIALRHAESICYGKHTA